jgi:hypothetical protein
VYDLAAGEVRKGFRPKKKFFIHVSRNLPERVDADVAAARAFVQYLFTYRGAEAAHRTADFDFKTVSLWQFVVLAIGAAIAGDVQIKLMYFMIG